MRRCNDKFVVRLALVATLVSSGYAVAQSPDVPAKYRGFFHKTTPEEGFWAKIGRWMGWTDGDPPYTRSYAIVAGVWDYEFDRLEMAERDVSRLIRYLDHYESFDEIVVLTNSDFNDQNLRFFLQEYFPKRLRGTRSRFLFAFSGHGITREIAAEYQGFLVLPTASRLNDFANAMPYANLMAYARGVAEAHHTLFLLNSCFSGQALEKGGEKGSGFETTESIADLLSAKAFHVLTAGAANEQVSGSGRWGGSLFFAVVLEALKHGDRDKNGVVSFNELEAYVRPAVVSASGRKQHPQREDKSPQLHPDTRGSFLFFNREKLVAAGVVSELPEDVEKGGVAGLTSPGSSSKETDIPPPSAGNVWRAPLSGMRFRYIPAGNFLRGSKEYATQHRVILTRGFWMGETEVTGGSGAA